jgi:hypothetical protein
MTLADPKRVQLGLSEARWLANPVGTGSVAVGHEGVRLILGLNDGESYSNAQLDDYLTKGVMRWRPPVEMTLRARFSHPQALLRGTAGFGFWNHPFGMTKVGDHSLWLPRLRLPQAIWFFFASPPSSMSLALGVPGFGWKAATVDASNWRARALLPLAPLGILACRWSWGYRLLWPVAQRVLKVDESLLPVTMNDWHTYRLVWEGDGAHFFVDGVEVARTRFAPHGPLGFVTWIDNQYMVATPQGNVDAGVIGTERQWLEFADLEVTMG